jgi:hypothetical protein
MPTASTTRAEEFREQLARRAMVADGAMGTMLYSRGVCFDELKISTPDMVRQIHQEYVTAGAEILETQHVRRQPHAAGGLRAHRDHAHNGCCHGARHRGASDSAAVRTVAACGLRSSGKMIEHGDLQ